MAGRWHYGFREYDLNTALWEGWQDVADERERAREAAALAAYPETGWLDEYDPGLPSEAERYFHPEAAQ